MGSPSASQVGFEERLLQASSCKEFLGLFFKPTSPLPSPVSYAELSRRAGFASRAYAREVVLGQRKLTLQAIPKFARGLKLSRHWKDYFELLALRDGAAAQPSHSELVQIERRLIKARELIRSKIMKLKVAGEVPLADRVLDVEHAPQIYAALGTKEFGATLEEVVLRTGLPRSQVQAALTSLLSLGIVEQDRAANRYQAKSMHLALTEVGRSEAFQALFLKSVEHLRKRSTLDFGSSEQLFLNSSFCVRRADMKALKSRLRELMIEFIDSSEEPEGNCVVNLVAGLTLS